MNSREKTKEIQDITEQLQDTCHATVKFIIENSEKQISYQDATNTWLFYQLALIKSDINDINRKIESLN